MCAFVCVCEIFFIIRFKNNDGIILFTEFKKISQKVLTTCFTLIYLIPKMQIYISRKMCTLSTIFTKYSLIFPFLCFKST